jgi:hypothetical protein
MPKSSGRPKNRQPKRPKVERQPALCLCGGKPTRFGMCVRCLGRPEMEVLLRAVGLGKTRAERRKV